MMFSTTYQNNQRIVSGVNPVFNDDVVLLCNTSSGAVTINLSSISANYWNTTWKLYVVDNSNNATTNNITINAGSGQTINGQSSLTINTNGGQALIRVSSNTSFIAELSTGGGSSLVVKKDNTTIVSGVNILNFIGSTVTVTTPSTGQANITIDALGYQILSNSQLLGLINTSALNIGWTYIVNDVTNADNYVAVQAIATNAVQNYGAGYFLNADYQAVGDYSGVSGYVSQTGIWQGGSATYVVGNICIWNNRHYKNITGSNSSTEPSSDTTNWSLLTKNLTNGYILAVDYVIYDVNSNIVRKRVDSKNNEVDYTASNLSFANFQWGRNAVTYNKLINGSVMYCVNSPCTFTNNFLDDNSSITDTTNALLTRGFYIGNVLTRGSIEIGSNEGSISYNTIQSGSYFNIDIVSWTTAQPLVEKNTFEGESYILISTLQAGTTIRWNTFSSKSYMKTVGTVLISNSNLDSNKFSSVSRLQINNNVTQCNIYESTVEGRSYILVTGAYSGNVRNNVLSVNSYLTLNNGVAGCDCSGNRLYSFSYMTIGSNSGQIDNNLLFNTSNIQITTNQNDSYVSGNQLDNNSQLLLTTCNALTRLRYNYFDNSTVTINSIANNFQYNRFDTTTATITTCTGTFVENIFESSTLTLTTNNSIFSYNYSNNSTIDITTNNNFRYNSLIQSSTITILTNNGDILKNVLEAGNIFVSGSIDVNSTISYNILAPNCLISVGGSTNTTLSIDSCNLYTNSQLGLSGNNSSSNYTNLTINNGAQLTTGVFTNSDIANCEISGLVTIALGNQTSKAYTAKSYRLGFSNWEADLDLSNTEIYSGGTLITVPASLGTYVGIYNVINCGGITVDTIANLTTNHPITFIIGDATLLISKIPAATAGADMIVGLQSLSTLTATYTNRATISDNFVVQKLTQGVGCLSLFEENIYA